LAHCIIFRPSGRFIFYGRKWYWFWNLFLFSVYFYGIFYFYVDAWSCIFGWRAIKHEFNKIDDETELDIKKGKHSGACIISFHKEFFVLCKKAWAPEWQGKCYQVRRMRRYHPKMHPWSQHKKVEDGTELDIKKEEITEPILFSPMKVEPDESASNELQPIDNVYLHNNTVHLYFCIVCNVSFTDKRIKTDWILFSKCLRITYIGYNNGFHWYQFLALVQPLNSHTYRNKVTHFLYPSPTLTWLHRIISVTEQL